MDIFQAPADKNLHKDFLSGSLFSAGGMVFGGGLTLIAGIVFARWLGPYGFGVYSLVLVAISLVGGIGTLGLDNALARFAAFYLGTGESSFIRGLFRYGLLRVAAASSILAFGLFAALQFRLLDRTRLAPLASHSWLLFAAIPLYALQLTLLQSLLGLQGVKPRVFLEKIIQPVCRLAVPFVAVLWLANRESAAVLGVLGSTLVLVAASAVLLRQRAKSFLSGEVIAFSEKKKWLNYALPFVFYSLQNFVWAGMGLDVFLVGALLSVHDAGVYAAIFRVTPILGLARGAMEYSFGPRAAVLFGQSNLKSMGVLYRSTSSLALAWTLPVALLLAIFGAPIMRVLFGSGYEAGGLALALLVIGFVVDSATGCNVTLLSMAGHSGLVLVNGIFGGVTLLLLSLILIPRWGIAGAALATGSSIVITNIMATAEIWTLYRLQPFSRDALRLLIAATAAAILMWYWRGLVLPALRPEALGLILSAGVTVLAYLGILFAMTRSVRSLLVGGAGSDS